MVDLRDLLPRTHGVFIGRFGAPTPVQAEGIPPAALGRDVLLCAPTASGKTEAFAAPMAEAVLAMRPEQTGALVISPTRALANDLFRRLETRMEDVGLSFGRYTGEHKDRIEGRLPRILVATPEALDSLLARRRALLAGIGVCVLDEIHVMDGSARGDHLRLLLHRLDLASGRRVQRIAASATVEDPAGVAGRYLRDAALVVVPGRRPIRFKLFMGGEKEDVARHLDELARAGFRKVLVFCNRRADVENLTSHLRQHSVFAERVLPHHGSLSRNVRERTEQQFLEAPFAAAVATLTLEMGIDIGSVDYVLNVGPPAGVASLLQRIGRGNRRAGETRAGCTVSRPRDARLATAQVEAAAAGRLLGGPYVFRPGAVIQQALVIAAAEDWIDARRLESSLPSWVFPIAGLSSAADILQRMTEEGLLEAAGQGRFTLAEKIESRYDRGVLHANIGQEPEVEIVDRLTGEILGTVAADQTGRVQIGGVSRRIVGSDAEGRLISRDESRREAPAAFLSKGVPLTSRAFALSVIAPLGAGPRTFPCFRHGDSWVLLHGFGTLGSLPFDLAVESTFGSAAILRRSAFGLRLALDRPQLPGWTADSGRKLLAANEKRFEKLCSMGPYHRHLPRDLRLTALAQACDLDGIGHAIVESKLHFPALTPESAADWSDLV